MKRFWPILALILIPLIPLHRAVFLGECIGPFDQIKQMAPWHGPAPEQPWDVLQADGVLQFYPWRDLVLKAWGQGVLPLWNPYELAGTPLLANSQSGALYPPHVVLGMAHLPTSTAITLLAWFHLAWAGIGTYLLCRRFGGNSVGWFIAGASFSLSAFMLSWTAMASVISTVAWIPWLLLAISRLTADDAEDADRKPGILARIPAIAICTGMMLLAGHLQFAAYGMIAALIMLFTLKRAGILAAVVIPMPHRS